ncbi:MAG: ribosomal protein S18-alanine N-acetyltransferase [Lachnospiraceae bacterium]|nr:ribosomal protein S18-alanine N-acetyltransferase [Lachnospiraceae bacterium]
MIDFREMREEDVTEVAKLEKDTFTHPWKEKDFQEMVRAEYAHFIVAADDGELIGSCGLRNILGEGEITNVVMRPEYRNMGIGLNMLCKLMKDGEKLGVRAYTLEVRESNMAAIHVYEKIGFRPEGMRKNFYEDPTEDAVIMWKR